jgi:hypothetical protein
MHILLFDMNPLHNEALLVSFNELHHPFEKEAFRLLTKPRLHRILDVSFQATGISFIALEKPGRNICALLLMLATHRAQTSRYPKSSCTMTCADPWLMPWCPLHVLSHPSSLIKVSTPLDVLVRAWCRWASRSAFISYTCSSLLKAFYSLVDLSLMTDVYIHEDNLRWEDSYHLHRWLIKRNASKLKSMR